MRLGVLFSGGKDSVYSAWLAKNEGNELLCLISLHSKNPDSFMFHTPAIDFTKIQAEYMNIPILIQETRGEKEEELKDLEIAISLAKEKFGIEGIVSGAIASHYQKRRIESICEKLGLAHITPIWEIDQINLLEELVRAGFDIVISAVAAYPLDKSWVGRTIDKEYITSVKSLSEDYGINPAGEGGEFETLVVNCPLFKKSLSIKLKNVVGKDNSWRGVFELG